MNELSNERHPRPVACPGDAIWWHDGLLLEPAHFEQMCRRQEQLVSFHVRSAAPCNWGVRRIDIADEFLSKDLFAISWLEAIMPDGLVVSHQADAGNLEFSLTGELREQLAGGRSATICLAVPIKESIDDIENGARYAPAPAEGEGDSGAIISHVRPRLRLGLAGELEKKLSDTVLPLARITIRSGKFELERFVPPLLDVRVTPPASHGASLHADSVKLTHEMEQAANYLFEATARHPVGVEDRLHRLEVRAQLACVVAGIPMLHGVLGLPGLSPVTLYLAWCAALGPLGALDDTGEMHKRAFPAYRHDELALTFGALFERVRALLAGAQPPFLEVVFVRGGAHEYIHKFAPAGRYAWAAADIVGPNQAAQESAVLIVGLRGMTEALAADWMEKAVIAPSAQLAACREERRMGARRSLIKPDGNLVLLQGTARVHERQVEARGLGASDLILFAIDIDEPGGTEGDIVLQNNAREAPVEVAIFLHRAAT